MSYRRRHRWLRRLAVGLAFAAFAAPATAKVDEGDGSQGHVVVTAGGWTGAVDPQTGVPLSAGIPSGLESELAPVVGEDPLAKALANAPSATPFVQGVSDFPPAAAQFRSATRPDDRSDRFAHSDAVPTGTGVLSSGTDWNEGLALGLGAVVLALALGMALGYISRPRLAGTH